ncbi:MAG TPA: XapX domain-containing protein [Euryarchaeota archaeon]|nr:XapX domain-containing protein [Euryarchaeota archaeon]
MSYQSLAMAFLTGFIVGVIFKLLKLPVPAPSTWEGVIGVFGIFLGYLVVKMLGL